MALYTIKEYFTDQSKIFEDYLGDSTHRKPVLPPKGNIFLRYAYRLAFAFRRSLRRAYCDPSPVTDTSYIDASTWEKGEIWAGRDSQNLSRKSERNFKKIIGLRILNPLTLPYFLVILLANIIKYGLYIPLKSFLSNAEDLLARKVRFDTWRHKGISILLLIAATPLLIPLIFYAFLRALQLALCFISIPLFMLARVSDHFYAPLRKAYCESAEKKWFWTTFILAGLIVASYIACCIFTGGLGLFTLPLFASMATLGGPAGIAIITSTLFTGFLIGIAFLDPALRHLKNAITIFFNWARGKNPREESPEKDESDSNHEEALLVFRPSDDNENDKLEILARSEPASPPRTPPKTTEAGEATQEEADTKMAFTSFKEGYFSSLTSQHTEKLLFVETGDEENTELSDSAARLSTEQQTLLAQAAENSDSEDESQPNKLNAEFLERIWKNRVEADSSTLALNSQRVPNESPDISPPGHF